jgi:serine/threonine-protein kinase
MGVVYKAFHPELKRTVALKVLIAGEDASENAIERFHREAEAVAKLGHHPNIVPVYDIGKITREPALEGLAPTPLHYIAMHFVDGKPLDHLIDGGEIAPKRAAIITKKIAEALHHAHRQGILHRDIKPPNILFSKEGEPQITDFGLAKDVQSESSMTRSGMTLGTPQYMPPEQAEGRLQDVDERSDIYALGATFYEMLTFRPPFDGTGALQVIHKALNTDPVSPRRLNASIDRDLETVCLKCMEKEPGKRYGNAKTLAEDLDRFLEGRPILARPASAIERFWKRVRRNKTLSAVVGILILVLIGASVAGVLGVLQLKAGEKELDEFRTEADAQKAKAQQQLEKSRLAARVLMKAYSSLGETHGALKNAYYDYRETEETRRKIYERHRENIEKFCVETPTDSASQATMLAVKGWLKRLGGFEEESFALFRQAREKDGEVAWGGLFEAMVWLSVYLTAQPMPLGAFGERGLRIDEAPEETPEMKKARRRYEGLLQEMEKDPAWGATTMRNFREILSGFRAIQGRDPETATRSLTRGLALPEMAWLREELVFTRARTHLLRNAFDEGVADVTEVLDRLPAYPAPYNLLISLHRLRGYTFITAGRDPRNAYRKVIAVCDDIIRKDPDIPFAYYVRGYSHLHLGDVEWWTGTDPRNAYREGIHAYTRALEKSPELVVVLLARSTAYLDLGIYESNFFLNTRPWFEKALADSEKALSKEPKSVRTLSQCALARLNMALFSNPPCDNPEALLDRAVADLQIALSKNPQNFSLHFLLGDIFHRRAVREISRGREPGERFTKALAAYDQALRIDAGYYRLHHHRGNLFRAMADFESGRGGDPRTIFDKALQAYAECLKRNAKFSEAFVDRGFTYEAMARSQISRGGDAKEAYRNAIADCSQAIELNPRCFKAHHLRGTVYAALAEAAQTEQRLPETEIRKAFEDFNKTLEINPQLTKTYSNRGGVHMMTGKMEMAQGLDPLGSFERAIKDFEAALRGDPDLASAFTNRSYVYRLIGLWEESRGIDPRPTFQKAIRDLNEAHLRDPESPLIYDTRGNLFMILGLAEMMRGLDPRESYLKAVRDFGETIRINPRHHPAWEALGNTHQLAGRAEASRGNDPTPSLNMSLKAYEKAIRLNPNNWRARVNMGHCLEMLGALEKAVRIYEETLTLFGERSRKIRFWLNRAKDVILFPPWAQALHRTRILVSGDNFPISIQLYEAELEKAKTMGAYGQPTLHPLLRGAHFDLTCFHAQASLGKTAPLAEPKKISEKLAAEHRDKALLHLRKAFETGFTSIQEIRKNPQIAPLRDLPEFQALLNEWEEKLGKGK